MIPWYLVNERTTKNSKQVCVLLAALWRTGQGGKALFEPSVVVVHYYTVTKVQSSFEVTKVNCWMLRIANQNHSFRRYVHLRAMNNDWLISSSSISAHAWWWARDERHGSRTRKPTHEWRVSITQAKHEPPTVNARGWLHGHGKC